MDRMRMTRGLWLATLIAAPLFGRADEVMAWDSPAMAQEQAYDCAAVVQGDIDALRRSLKGPLQPFARCPNTDITPADIATEHFSPEQWQAFRALASATDRMRLTNMRLRYLINIGPNQLTMTQPLAAIEQLLDDGGLPVDNGRFMWGDAGRLLEILEMEPPRATAEDKAQVIRLFEEKILAQAPAEHDADLSYLWPGLLNLPEPQLLASLQVLKSKFAGFNPSSDAWQKSKNIDYPLNSTNVALAISRGASRAVVLAMVDLRLPAPPDARAWGAAIDSGRMDLVELFLQQHYPVPLENQGEVWQSPLLNAAQAFARNGDGHALDLLLAASPPAPLRPDVVDRVLSIVLFANPKSPASLTDSLRWHYVDRIVSAGANPNRLFGDKRLTGNTSDIIDLIRRQPQVAVGLLRHGLSPTAPLQPSGGNLLDNYLMTAGPAGDESPSIDIIKAMLKGGSSINQYDAGVGHFPLEFAVMNYSTEFGRAFLGLGADIKVRDPGGYGLLIRASAYGYLKLVKFLLDAGADPNEASADGITPLAIAQCKGHEDVVQLLLQRRAKPMEKKLDCGGA